MSHDYMRKLNYTFADSLSNCIILTLKSFLIFQTYVIKNVPMML